MALKTTSTLSKLAPWLLRIMCIGFVAHDVWFYTELNNALTAKPQNITYTYLSKRYESKSNYIVSLIYNGNNYEAHVTRDSYEKATETNPPELYYAPDLDQVFSKWELKRSIRSGIILTIIFALSFLPWRKWEKQLKS